MYAFLVPITITNKRTNINQISIQKFPRLAAGQKYTFDVRCNVSVAAKRLQEHIDTWAKAQICIEEKIKKTQLTRLEVSDAYIDGAMAAITYTESNLMNILFYESYKGTKRGTYVKFDAHAVTTIVRAVMGLVDVNLVLSIIQGVLGPTTGGKFSSLAYKRECGSRASYFNRVITDGKKEVISGGISSSAYNLRSDLLFIDVGNEEAETILNFAITEPGYDVVKDGTLLELATIKKRTLIEREIDGRCFNNIPHFDC